MTVSEGLLSESYALVHYVGFDMQSVGQMSRIERYAYLDMFKAEKEREKEAMEKITSK